MIFKRKIIPLLILLYYLVACSPFSLTGQSVSINDSIYYHNLSFTIQGGINKIQILRLPSIFATITDTINVFYRTENLEIKSGFQAGIGVEYQWNRFFSVQSSLEYMHYQIRFDYEEEHYNNVFGLYLERQGFFEHHDTYLRIPLLFVSTFGEKLQIKIGIGGYWASHRSVSGSWVRGAVAWGARKEGEDWERFGEPISSGEIGYIKLPIKTRNMGFLGQIQFNIPLTWNIEYFVNGQFAREWSELPTPSISKKQLFLNTGFRFRLKYSY